MHRNRALRHVADTIRADIIRAADTDIHHTATHTDITDTAHLGGRDTELAIAEKRVDESKNAKSQLLGPET